MKGCQFATLIILFIPRRPREKVRNTPVGSEKPKRHADYCDICHIEDDTEERMPDSIPSAAELARFFRLEPLPLEGGLFRQTWAGQEQADGHPSGTAILLLLSAEDGHFSALHRLPRDEVWHFYLGDPVQLLLLEPDGGSRVEVLGQDVRAGQHVQYVVPGGTWIGARVRPGGDRALLGSTMAPGFVPADYEGGDEAELSARYPLHAGLIRALCRHS
jgi:predicted cupin superfamily sugar epimerase